MMLNTNIFFIFFPCQIINQFNQINVLIDGSESKNDFNWKDVKCASIVDMPIQRLCVDIYYTGLSNSSKNYILLNLIVQTNMAAR